MEKWAVLYTAESRTRTRIRKREFEN